MKIRTMRGKQLDMAGLIARNSHTIALGNASMNARGDIVKNGKVIKLREQITMEYNQHNPQAVRNVGIKSLMGEIFTPAEAVAQQREKNKVASDAEAARIKAQKTTEALQFETQSKRKLIGTTDIDGHM